MRKPISRLYVARLQYNQASHRLAMARKYGRPTEQCVQEVGEALTELWDAQRDLCFVINGVMRESYGFRSWKEVQVLS